MVTATFLADADSAFRSAKLIKACREAVGVQFSITVANMETVRASIEGIPGKPGRRSSTDRR